MLTTVSRTLRAARARVRSSRWLRAARARLVRDRRRRRTHILGLRRVRPRTAGAGAYARADATVLAGRLHRIVAAPELTLRTWLERKPATATYLHPVDPDATPAMRAKATQLLAGEFTPHTSVAPRHERLPPSWAARPDTRRTEEMYRHSLRWLEPLVAVAHADGDRRAWDAATSVITSWIDENSRPPGRSAGAWHDHAVSIRVRILCWFFELYRRRPTADPAVLRLLVASIHQHGLFLADDSTYTPRSNHALETNGSLLAVCATLPELRGAAAWERLARTRLERYVAEAFTDDGFSKEQSPRYHFFVLRRLAALVSYLNAVGETVPPSVVERLHQAAVVWPWLVRDDGSMPRVGDTNDRTIGHWRQSLTEATGSEPPPAAPSSIPSPRNDEAALLVSFDAGYAVFTGHHPATEGADDTHVLFKCNYFRYPHFHRDGLSFVFYAAGREWLIDPGPHSYEYDRWERRYLCSSSAHNVVEIGARFAVHPVEFVAAARTDDGDRVTVRHLLGHATHTRTVEHRPPRLLRITDEIVITDGEARDIRQLFHVHPECGVSDLGGGRLRLTSPDGASCDIIQRLGGVWRMVRGQRYPETLGWRSPGPMMIEPITTCSYTVQADGHVRFETIIQAHPGPTPVRRSTW